MVVQKLVEFQRKVPWAQKMLFKILYLFSEYDVLKVAGYCFAVHPPPSHPPVKLSKSWFRDCCRCLNTKQTKVECSNYHITIRRIVWKSGKGLRLGRERKADLSSSISFKSCPAAPATPSTMQIWYRQIFHVRKFVPVSVTVCFYFFDPSFSFIWL